MDLFRAGPAWMRRGMQGHVAAPRGPAQRLRGALYILYSYITYSIRGIQHPVYREGIRPLRSSGVIYPTILSFYFCVGLIHTDFYNVGDVERRGATDQMGDRSTRVDCMRRGPPTDQSNTCYLKRVITLPIWSDLERPSAI